MKKLLFIVGILVVIQLVIGVFLVADHFLGATPTQAATVHCDRTGVEHEVFIQDGKLDPAGTVHGVLCDTLTITNEDNRLRLMAFGTHDHHQAYDGVTTKVLGKGQSLTVTFDKAGDFTYHDHLDDSVVGYFVVSQ